MTRKLRDANELDKEIESVAKNIIEAHDFFEYIRQFDFGVKDVLSRINAKKYDELTKDFNGIDFYMALKKRICILHDIEYSKSIELESYNEMDIFHDFSEDENDSTVCEMSEEDFLLDRDRRVFDELIDTIEHLESIFYGDAITLKKSDIKYLRGAETKKPIVAIDMPHIAFMNRYAGFMGGMNEQEYNSTIGGVIQGDSNMELVKKVRDIPNGYGWESCSLHKKTIWAEVDLNASDSILIEAFKNWLPHARELHSNVFSEDNVVIKNKFKKSLIKKWKDLRVLAYLDMKILADYFSQHPTMKQYADCLYFDQYDIDITEKVRKTLIPIVNDIEHGDCLEDLIRQIHAEENLI
ncbi:DUF6387 family protein [Pectobacterium sp. CHL-2024]|uniref:DUF6387 family protein n=1 Tax=Pectobacterium sp. CHL-2024 TaxID=3377079 RepID=UPI00381DB070